MSTLIEALSGLTFTEDIDHDEMVADAVVIVRLIHQETGRESFTLASSKGIGSITQLGLIIAAHDVVRSVPGEVAE